MKNLTIIFLLLTHNITNTIEGQPSSPSTTARSQGDNIDSGNKQNPFQKKPNEEFYHQRKLLNDCASITKTAYHRPANYVSKFVQLTDGQTYTGSAYGIVMWDNYSVVRITTENSKIPENNITALAMDDSDKLWIGTYSSGIVIGTGNDVLPYRIHSIQTRDQHVASISVDKTGLVWVVYKNGAIECFLNEISCSYFPNE